MSIENLQYTIVNFDAANKVVHVDFGPDGRAAIPLVEPLPSNKDELDKIVRTFAAPLEALQARATPSTDLSFITAMVNQPQQTERFSFVKASQPPAELPPASVQEVRARKLEQIAAWRYARETAGLLLGSSMIKTDRESQAQLAGAYSSLRDGMITAVNWKSATGDFVALTLAEVGPIAGAVAQHVQACFSAEMALVTQLDQALAGITDVAQAIAAADSVVMA